MALGKRQRERQEMWVASTDLPRSPGHPFYCKLNELLAEAGFDGWIEKLCAPHYHQKLGRPSIPPGVYFRMILVGYFEGIASQRGIAWRCSDSRSLAEFLGVPVTQPTPDHSSLSRTHGRLPLELHEQMFQFVLGIAAQKKLVDGKTVGVDSTMLEANAAMKSIVRKDSGEDYKEYLKRLANEAGLEKPSDEDLRRFDRKREDKKVSNAEWESPTDPDSRIAKMKDGTTHLAYKAENVVDLKTDLVLSARVVQADESDSDSLCDSLVQATANLEQTGSAAEIRDVAGDKGYHATSTLAALVWLGFRSYIPEPHRPHRRHWTDKPTEEQEAVYANRRRVRGARSKKLQRLRSEKNERSFAHLCETGGGRRCWLRGLVTVAKRYLLQAAARNLGLILRKLFGMGTPRGLQDLVRFVCALYFAISACWGRLRRSLAVSQKDRTSISIPTLVTEFAA